MRSRKVFDRLRDFLPDRTSKCRGAHGWARAAHAEIRIVIPLTQKTPQPIKSSTDLTQHLTKQSGWARTTFTVSFSDGKLIPSAVPLAMAGYLAARARFLIQGIGILNV